MADEVTPFRRRLERGDWRALSEPAGEGLLMMALFVDTRWWLEAWSACLAELLRPWWRGARQQRFGRRATETAEYADATEDERDERDRQRWKLSIYPAYWFDLARHAYLRRPNPDQQRALDALGRWLP